MFNPHRNASTLRVTLVPPNFTSLAGQPLEALHSSMKFGKATPTTSRIIMLAVQN